MFFIIGYFIAFLIGLFLDWKASKNFQVSILYFCIIAASGFGFVISVIIYLVEWIASRS